MIKIKTASGPGAGESSVSVRFGEFEKVAKAQATMTGGYICKVSISGNTVTVTPQYFDYDAAADGVAIDVPASEDLSGETITVVAEGY